MAQLPECSICLDILSDPMVDPCGHSFCRKCIKEWLATNQTCPKTRAPLTIDVLKPNYDLRTALEFISKRKADPDPNPSPKKLSLEEEDIIARERALSRPALPAVPTAAAAAAAVGLTDRTQHIYYGTSLPPLPAVPTVAAAAAAAVGLTDRTQHIYYGTSRPVLPVIMHGPPTVAAAAAPPPAEEEPAYAPRERFFFARRDTGDLPVRLPRRPDYYAHNPPSHMTGQNAAAWRHLHDSCVPCKHYPRRHPSSMEEIDCTFCHEPACLAKIGSRPRAPFYRDMT